MTLRTELVRGGADNVLHVSLVIYDCLSNFSATGCLYQKLKIGVSYVPVNVESSFHLFN